MDMRPKEECRVDMYTPCVWPMQEILWISGHSISSVVSKCGMVRPKGLTNPKYTFVRKCKPFTFVVITMPWMEDGYTPLMTSWWLETKEKLHVLWYIHSRSSSLPCIQGRSLFKLSKPSVEVLMYRR